MHQQPGYSNGNKRSAVRKFDPGFPVTHLPCPWRDLCARWPIARDPAGLIRRSAPSDFVNACQLSVTCRLVRPPRARRSSAVSGASEAKAPASRSANSAAGFSMSSAVTELGRSQTGTVSP